MKKRAFILFTTFCMTMQLTVGAAGLSGVCGEGVKYSFDKKTNILTLSGSGSLYDYEYYNDLPWYGYSTKIEHVELGGGIRAPLWTLNRRIAVACGKMKKDKIKTTPQKDAAIIDNNGATISGDTMDSKLH